MKSRPVKLTIRLAAAMAATERTESPEPAAIKSLRVKLAIRLTAAVVVTDLIMLAAGLPPSAVLAATAIATVIIAAAAGQLYVTRRLTGKQQ